MTVLELKSPIKSKKVPKGTILSLQRSQDKALSFLHSGMAELLMNGEDVAGKSPEEVLAGSIRVGLIKSNSIYGVMGLHESSPYMASVRALTDCIVTSNPIEPENVIPVLQANPRLNLRVLRALQQRVESAIFLFSNYKYLWHKLASVADSIALAVDLPEAADLGHEADRYTVDLAEYSAFLKRKTSEAGLSLPTQWDPNVFLGSLQNQLELYKEEDAIRVEDVIDHQQFVFFRRVLRKPDEILLALFRKDEPTNFYVFQCLTEAFERMLVQNEKIVLKTDRLIRSLFADDGWISRLLGSQDKNDERVKLFNHYLWRFCWRSRKDALQLLGRDLRAEYPAFADLIRFEKAALPVTETSGKDAAAPAQAAAASGKGLAKYKGLLRRILQFADLGDDFDREFVSLIASLKKRKDKFEISPEAKKLRARLTDMYWQLYAVCYGKTMDTDLKGFVPGIMLHFGLVDETLVSRESLAFIDSAYAQNLYVDRSIPVMTLPYFLEKIFRSEINPSLTEMGENFRAVLKRQEKMTKQEKQKSTLYRDTPEDKVSFELKEVVEYTSKLLFGSKEKALPILCEDAIIGKIERTLVLPEALAERIEEYRRRDFSVFYREVVCHHKFGNDVIKKEVLPNFVLYPTVGSRAMMWQELDGAKRDTPGRIFFPLVFVDKLEETLLTMLGHFRWELQKVMAGAKWTDPVDGGLVGAYYDYIQFYRKNPGLSPEAKEKVTAFIKKTRSDRDRFSMDYATWVSHEYEGRIRFNPVARDIFYRFCPFRKEQREALAQRPLYTDLETKYQNRARKLILRMASRKTRFEKAGEPLPEDLAHYIEFLEM